MKRVIAALFLLPGMVFARENSATLYREGAASARAGDFKQAEELFLRARQLSPSYVLPHYGLGRVYLQQPDRLDDAVDSLRRAIACDKRYSRAHFYLGMAYMLRKNYPHAIRAFADAYEYDKTAIEALYNIGAIYDLMDHPFKSRKYYQLYLKRKEKLGSDEIDFEF